LMKRKLWLTLRKGCACDQIMIRFVLYGVDSTTILNFTILNLFIRCFFKYIKIILFFIFKNLFLILTY
jgi:hypothetical protein